MDYQGIELSMETIDWSHFEELWRQSADNPPPPTPSSARLSRKAREARMKQTPDGYLYYFGKKRLRANRKLLTLEKKNHPNVGEKKNVFV